MGLENNATVLATKELELTMLREGSNRERIGVERVFPNEYPKDELSRNIFRWFSLMYIVSPYLPSKITTDFSVPEPIRHLIEEMYVHEGAEKPNFHLTDKKLAKVTDYYKFPKLTNDEKAVLTYSGGKDTLQNLNWMERAYGLDNILAVHFKGMNRVNSDGEYRMSLEQSKHVGFPIEILDLLNGSKNYGREIMRARDMFIVGVTSPIALRFGASNIVLEGCYYNKNEGQGEPFTTHLYAWKLFNKTLESLGLPVQADWRDCEGVEAVAQLAQNHPDWLHLVSNCFIPPHRRRSAREKWGKNTPSLLPIGENCGSCVKCREVTLGRIGNDPTLHATKEDVVFFLKDTIKYFSERPDKWDIMGKAFEKRLWDLASLYGIND